VAEEAKHIGEDDLCAAIAAGIVTEAQAASICAMAHDRAGRRAALPAEDEPFEFFRGFAEIFVSVGLIILLFGISLMLGWFGGIGVMIALPAISAAIAWWWATYFTLERRMNLPSMVLAIAFGTGVYLSALTILSQTAVSVRAAMVLASLAAAAGMAGWYRRFRLPFAMFVLGMFGLGAIYAMTASLESIRAAGTGFGAMFFDLRNSPTFALGTFVFGVAAFAGGMWFAMCDPYRLGRHSATAFWLHMLAAPALVNTISLTLYNVGGTAGMVATAIALALIAMMALVIDRRSFLTASIAYIALLISWMVRGSGAGGIGHWALILIALGVIVTALGTWWVPLRNRLMRALPDFPGKSRLPPYSV